MRKEQEQKACVVCGLRRGASGQRRAQPVRQTAHKLSGKGMGGKGIYHKTSQKCIARQNPRTEPVWEEQLEMSREQPDHVPIRRRHHHPGHSQRNADRM